MSDAAQVLGWTVDGKEAPASAARVLSWLVERGIVEALPTDCGLSVLAHRPGPRALEVVVPQRPRVSDFRTLTINGVELTYTFRPELLLAGDEMPEFACPVCGAEVASETVMERLAKPENPFLAPPQVVACARCNSSLVLNELTVNNGAFVNVVLRFWNWWPLKEELVAELREMSGGSGVAVFHERF
jgi:hypothetical protein